MALYIDIDNTICSTNDAIKDPYERYLAAVPIQERIDKVNTLYDSGKEVIYWTARGNTSGIDVTELTEQQLKKWGCKYHRLMTGKPSFELLIDDKVHNVDTYWPIYKTGNRKYRSTHVSKGWGAEDVFVNNEHYCGKLLKFNKGAKFSMHYHLKKKETWYVCSGTFEFLYIDTNDATIYRELLTSGDVITNEIGAPHQLKCIEAGTLFEVSTTHFDEDSYRVLKGDSQQ